MTKKLEDTLDRRCRAVLLALEDNLGTDAVRSVLNLHKPVPLYSEYVCAVCILDKGYSYTEEATYPCDTVVAIGLALKVF
jgi:hypothetical protein